MAITGVEATISLDRQVDGPTFGLGDGQAKVFFDRDPLAISQMSYDVLAFFPDPEDCEFTEGQHNEEAGLIAVRITCSELVDIRHNGSITLDGYAALRLGLARTANPAIHDAWWRLPRWMKMDAHQQAL